MARRSDVRYGAPERKGVAVRSTYGRVCDRSGCSTVLSTYNASSSCWMHRVPVFERNQPTR